MRREKTTCLSVYAGSLNDIKIFQYFRDIGTFRQGIVGDIQPLVSRGNHDQCLLVLVYTALERQPLGETKMLS